MTTDIIVTQVVGWVISIPVVLGILKIVSGKQLDQMYRKNFEKWKHRIDIEYDKALKINQKEMEVLPETWNRAVIVRDVILRVCLNRQDMYGNLNDMDKESFRVFVDGSGFPDFEKAILINSQDRNQAYKEVISNNGIHVANRTYYDYQNYIGSNQIFYTDQVYTHLKELRYYYHRIISVVVSFVRTDEVAREALFEEFQNETLSRLGQIGKLIKERIKFIE